MRLWILIPMMIYFMLFNGPLKAQISEVDNKAFVSEYKDLLMRFCKHSQSGLGKMFVMLKKYGDDGNKEAFCAQLNVLIERSNNPNLKLESFFLTYGDEDVLEVGKKNIKGIELTPYPNELRSILDRYPDQELIPFFPDPKVFGGARPSGILTGKRFRASGYYKVGKKSLEKGLSYEAASFMLDGLDLKVKKRNLNELSIIVGPAYDEQLKRIEKFIEEKQLHKAYIALIHLGKFRQSMERHQLLKGQVNPLPQAERIGSELAFRACKRGDELLGQGLLSEAELYYRECLYYAPENEAAFNGIAEVYYQQASKLQIESQFDDSVNAYIISGIESVNFKDAKTKASEILYQASLYYEHQNSLRAACKYMAWLTKVDSEYKDSVEVMKRLEKNAQFHIAVGSLKTEQDQKLNKLSLEQAIKAQLSARLIERASEFFVVDHESSDVTLEMEINDVSIGEVKVIDEKRNHFDGFLMNVDYGYHFRSRKMSCSFIWRVQNNQKDVLLDGKKQLNLDVKVEWADLISFSKNLEGTQLPSWLASLTGASLREIPSEASLLHGQVLALVPELAGAILAKFDRKEEVIPPDRLPLDDSR